MGKSTILDIIGMEHINSSLTDRIFRILKQDAGSIRKAQCRD